MMVAEDVLTFIKKHKGKFLITLALVLLVGGGIYLFGTFFLGGRMYAAKMAEEAPIPLTPERLPPREPVVEVREGRMTIKTVDAEKDSDKIKGYAQDCGGYVENFKKSDTFAMIRIVLTIRIPRDKFDEFFDRVKGEFKIKESNLFFYRLTIAEETTELDILDLTMKDLENIRKQINALPPGKDKIDLLMKLTEKQLEIRKKIRDYSATLRAKEELAGLSRVTITLEQEKPITIIPENLGRQFNEKMRTMVQNSATTLMNIVTGILPLILIVIQYLIFALVVILPFLALFIFLKGFYKKIEKKLKF